MQDNEKIRILLVDDHPFVLEGVRSCLTPHKRFLIVGEAVNGKQAIEKTKELSPSVIVMDITMPVMNGLDATRYLRMSVPEARVLILTVHEKREFTTQIIEAGARGYVSKNAPPSELMRAIETVHRGETFFTPSMTESFLKEYVTQAGQPKPSVGRELTMREREVLTLVAEGFCNKEAANLLGVSIRTVEKHRERIMSKLDLHSIVDLTKYAISHNMLHLD